MLKRFWKWVTRASERHVVYPFRPIGDAMRVKDPVLMEMAKHQIVFGE